LWMSMHLRGPHGNVRGKGLHEPVAFPRKSNELSCEIDAPILKTTLN
jgi:hypothetical protein